VLKGEKPDNYDSYSYQERICQQAGVQSRHFFLLGNYGKHDKNLAHNQEILRMLIKHTSQWSQVGIHPSMGSNSSMRQLKKEITRLKNITGHEVTKSRQHYLMLSLPETYQALISQRIEEDYTMGYADHIGFRAGTCSPFPWYDISKEQGTSLYLFPTAVMDSTLKDYMGLSIEESIVQMKKLRKTVEAVRGKFVILWHNHSAARQGEWVGWRQVLEAGLFN